MLSATQQRRYAPAAWLWRCRVILSLAIVCALAAPASAGFIVTASEKRAQVDLLAEQSLERLFRDSPPAEALFERSVGYAVFDATRVALFITGGGGTGVAVDRGTGERIYMHMGTGGLNLGLGAQVMRIVFLFGDHATFDGFVQGGWDAGAAAAAVAGRSAASTEASFVNGVAVYHLTDAGLLLGAEITGSRFWPSRKLNVPPVLETES